MTIILISVFAVLVSVRVIGKGGYSRGSTRDWLNHANLIGNHTAIGKVYGDNATYADGVIKPLPIRLSPCLYEQAARHIEPGSIDLILTDPPYLASSVSKKEFNIQGLPMVLTG